MASERASRPPRRQAATPVKTRRRGKALEEAIHQAVLDLLIEQGVGGVTMEAVAARAGTSKPVLYRRWPDRSALLRDTLVPLMQHVIPHTDTGSYREDMLAILRGWAAFFASPQGAIGPAIIGAMPQDPELADAFQSGVMGWRKEAMAEMLSRGIARGEVRPDVRVEVARELGQAFLWSRFLVTGDPLPDELLVHIVDHVLVPYVSPKAPAKSLRAGAKAAAGHRKKPSPAAPEAVRGRSPR